MNGARDLLLSLLLMAVPWISLRRWPEAIGPPAPSAPCPVVVEVAEVGVGCVEPARAARAHVHSGD